MRSTFTFILLTFALISFSQAQSASQLKKHRKLVKRSAKEGFTTYSLDTIYKAGVPQMALKQHSTTLFDVYDLGGKHLFKVQKNTAMDAAPRYAAYSFVPQAGEVAYAWEPVNWDQIQKTLIGNQIIENGYFNAEKWATYLEEHPSPARQEVRRGQLTKAIDHGVAQLKYDGKQLVERDRSQPVSMVGGEVFQDGKLIGTYTKTQEARAEMLHDIYRVFYLSGQISVTVNVSMEGAPRSVALLPFNGGSIEFQTQNIQVVMADLVARNYL